MFRPKRILVATDFTGESDAALREAVGIGEQFRSTIYLLHVITPVQQCYADYCLGEQEIAAEQKTLRENAELKMDGMIARTAPDSVVQIVKEIRFGAVVDEILAFEHENAIDLVVAAPHRHHRRWLKDTHHLTRDLVDRSTCEAMVVR